MRILGIDIGSSSIKAVEMDSAFGRYDIHDYHEQALATDQNPHSAVVELIQSLPKAPDRIIVSLSASLATFRNLQLPTRDKKAIQSSVNFELEDELPFSSENIISDYSILSQNKQGSQVHVSTTLRQHLTTQIQHWKTAGIEPDMITTEPWAYRALLNRVIPSLSQQNPFLLVQIGHSQTTLYLHWNNQPELIREFAWGGRDLTLAICQKYQIPVDQAETMKLDHGLIALPSSETPLTAEQTELSACIENCLKDLITELRQLNFTARNLAPQGISTLYLSGGTSLLPGLGPWIEEQIHIPTRPLLALSSSTSSGVTYSEQTDARFSLAVALTLCLVGSDRSSCINFRKGEFGKEVQSRQLNFNILKKPLIAVGIVSLSLFLSLIVQSNVYQSRLVTTNTQLERSIKSFFGQISNSALKTYMSNTKILRTSIDKELNKQRELSRLFGPNAHSPLDFLKHLSSTIPKNVVVDMMEFKAGSSAGESFVTASKNSFASLTFLVSNPQVAERLDSLLSTQLKNIQRGKMEEINSPNEPGGKKWKITFTGKLSEGSYGN